MKRTLAVALTVVFTLGVLASAAPASAKTCPNGKSSVGATFLSVLHPGVGEWHLNGYGNWSENMPQKKFWLGFVPIFGMPYLQIVSAIDSANCRTDDNLRFTD